LYYLQKKNEPCIRSLALREGGKNFYDALQECSPVFALSGSCVDIVFGAPGAGTAGWVGAGARSAISTFMSNKNIKLAELMQPVEPQPKSRRVI
jgi:hypothetical protein